MYVAVWLFLEKVMSAYVAIVNEFVNVSAYSFPKEVSPIGEYVLFVPVCPCESWQLFRMIEAKDVGTIKASNDLSSSCIILKSVQSLTVNLFLTDSMCGVLCMCLQ